MKFKAISSFAAVLTMLNAFFFLVLPEFSLSLLQHPTNAIGLLNTRLAGACALGLGAMTWFSRHSKSGEVQRVVYAGNLSAFGTIVLVDLYGLWVHAVNQLGWLIFVIDLLILMGFLSSAFTFGRKRP